MPKQTKRLPDEGLMMRAVTRTTSKATEWVEVLRPARPRTTSKATVAPRRPARPRTTSKATVAPRRPARPRTTSKATVAPRRPARPRTTSKATAAQGAPLDRGRRRRPRGTKAPRATEDDIEGHGAEGPLQRPRTTARAIGAARRPARPRTMSKATVAKVRFDRGRREATEAQPARPRTTSRATARRSALRARRRGHRQQGPRHRRR